MKMTRNLSTNLIELIRSIKSEELVGCMAKVLKSFQKNKYKNLVVSSLRERRKLVSDIADQYQEMP